MLLIGFWVLHNTVHFLFRNCHRLEELDPSCRQAILDNHRWVQEWTDHKSIAPHIFDDLKKQFSLKKKNFDESASYWDRQKQLDSINMKKYQYCQTHNAECAVRALSKNIDFDVSGLPCQDNSRARHRRKFFVKGDHGSVYLCWGRRHRLAKTPLLILENTLDS